MPLVRAISTASDPMPVETRETQFGRLGDPSADVRRRAAQALAGDPQAMSALGEHVATEADSSVREALISSLVAIGGTEVGSVMSRMVSSGDAGLRNAAVEALKRLGKDAVPALDALLDDPQSDTRILAIEVTRAWPSALAVPRLRRIIDQDSHVNVCGAAVDVATEVGTAELLGPLAGLRARFADQPFLLFAADIASSRIRSSAQRDV